MHADVAGGAAWAGPAERSLAHKQWAMHYTVKRRVLEIRREDVLYQQSLALVARYVLFISSLRLVTIPARYWARSIQM
jgi:hypothetical protein